MNNNYETYELILKDDEDGTFALSLVNQPAIMQDFIYFGVNQKEVVKFAEVDSDRHTIVGPILIPNLKIVRLNEDGTPYYVTFSKETVKAIAQKYIKDNNANNITIEHQSEVNDVSLVESWIVDSAKFDKAKAYGLNVKPGTWMGVFKVENPEVWAKVKSGDYKGISLEGLFTHELIKASAINLGDSTEQVIVQMIKDIIEEKGLSIDEISEEEADSVLEELKAFLKTFEMEGQPSIPSSSYPGEVATKKKDK
jgi:hypothetical protein